MRPCLLVVNINILISLLIIHFNETKGHDAIKIFKDNCTNLPGHAPWPGLGAGRQCHPADLKYASFWWVLKVWSWYLSGGLEVSTCVVRKCGWLKSWNYEVKDTCIVNIFAGSGSWPSSLGRTKTYRKRWAAQKGVRGRSTKSRTLLWGAMAKVMIQSCPDEKTLPGNPRGYSCCTGNSRHIGGNSMGTSAESTPATGADRTLCQILASPKASHLRHSPHQQNITPLWAGLLIFLVKTCVLCASGGTRLQLCVLAAEQSGKWDF